VRRFDRLLHLGNVVIDVVMDVPALPERGGDVLASGAQIAAGGGFNVIAAAARQGLPVAYAGAHGSGPFAALARAALAQERAEVLQQPKTGLDTGFTVSIVDAAGERTFVTSRGAEAALTCADLRAVQARPRDAIYLSGYGLLHPSSQRALLGWLERLDDRNVVFCDPGPLVHLIPPGVLDPVLRRADWWTCNAREAAALTGQQDPLAAAQALAEHAGQRDPAGLSGSPQRRSSGERRSPPARPGVLVRAGPAGCLIGRRDAAPVRVPGFPVDVLDTSGAGDTHTGTFIAALAAGAEETDAARTANAAAALSVTRRGPATAPTAAELARFLAGS
jgi:sugar/nucleoside kinase (ribokinase family)